jgi:NAD-dependent deacetylase
VTWRVSSADHGEPTVDAQLQRAATALRSARAIVVFTGAGISAESGVPTYRGEEDGLWSKHNLDRYANPRGYARHVTDAYAWYRARASSMADVQPNAGHVAIARLAERVPKLTVVTQNIDSLHQRAGSTDVIELHGNLREFRCDRCQWRATSDQAPSTPVCPTCGDKIRPDVVMFEENLPLHAFATARAAAQRCDVMLSVGTSNQVWPAAQLPLTTLEHGGSVIIVNPDLTDQPAHHNVIPIRLRAGDALPRLLELL